MKKNRQLGEKETEQLLEKLQESVLADGEKKKEPAPDRDELDFQNKIAAMLAKFVGTDAKKSKQKKKKQAPKADTAVLKEPPESEAVAEAESPSEIAKAPTVAEEPIAQESPAELPVEPKVSQKKKKSAKKKDNPQPQKADEFVTEEPSESVAEPTLSEETPTDEAPIEEISEDASVFVAEESVAEEKQAEEFLAEEAPVEETEAKEIPAESTEETETIEDIPVTEPITEIPAEKSESENLRAAKETVEQKPVRSETKAPIRPTPARPAPAKIRQTVGSSVKPAHAPSRVVPMPAVKAAEGKTPTAQMRATESAPVRRDPSQPIRIPREQPIAIPLHPNAQQKVDMQKHKNTELPKSREPKKEPDVIVIPPRRATEQSEPIVIKPRQVAPAPKPRKIEADRPSPPTEAEKSPKTVLTERPREEKPSSPAPKTQKRFGGTTLPRTHTVAKKPTPDVTSPKSAENVQNPSATEPAFEVVPKTIKPKVVKKHTQIPPRALSAADENLSEALEEMIPSAKEIGMSEESASPTTAKQESVKPTPAHPAAPVSPGEKRSRHSTARRRQRTVREAEEKMEALELIERKLGMTVEDIHLIFELGYENELGRIVGYETLKKLKFEHVRRARTPDESHFSMAYGYRDQEYTGKQKKDEILGNYVKDRASLIWRMIATVLLSVLLIPLDLHPLFGELLAPYASISPYLFPALSAVSLVLLALLHLRPISAGMRSLFRFTPTPYSSVALFLPVSLLYTLASLIFVGKSPMIPFALSAALSALLTDVCDLWRIGDEMRTFRILASGGAKTVLETEEPRKRKLRQGDKIVKIINDDIAGRFYRIRRSEQISGFFRRSNDFSSASRPFTVALAAVASLAFLFGVGASVWTNSFSVALSWSMLALSLTLPMTATLVYFYPRVRANRQLVRRNCALVGEESAGEYGTPKTVIFEDTDFYSVRKSTQSAIGSGEDFYRDIRLAGLLFAKIRGTLGALSKESQKENDPPVAVLRMTDNGTEAVVESQYHLLAGNAAFMEKNGIRIPKSRSEKPEQERVCVMYVAVDGALKLAYEIEYTVSKKFERIAYLLAQLDTTAAIRTYDPNLNDEFLQSGRSPESAYVRVLKPGRFEPDEILTVSDCGAVALGATSNICRPLVAATVIRHIRSVGYRLQAAATAIGAVGAVLLLVLNVPIPSAALALLPPLWHGVWTIASAIYTRISLRSGVAENLK